MKYVTALTGQSTKIREDGKTRLYRDKDGNTKTLYIYEKRISRKVSGSRAAQRRQFEFFLVHNCVVIAQWYDLLGFGGVPKAHPPEWKATIVPLLEKLSGGKLPPEEPDEEAERVETLHVHADGYCPTTLKVTLPASADGWKVTGAITDGKVGIANAVLRWEGSSTTTRAGADGSFSKPFGKQSAAPTVVVQDVQLAKSPPIKFAVMEGRVQHPFIPFPIAGENRTVQLVFTPAAAGSLAKHRGTIAFRNAKKLPFITLDAKPQTLGATGVWSVPVTVRKLVPSEIFSLADLPMSAEFEVAIEMPRWHTAIAKATFTVPLGAFIMMGSTVGPDYQKRYTPLAPRAITQLHLDAPERVAAGTVADVHLLGQVSPSGDFWTMVRAPEARETKKFLLQWDRLCKVPLLLKVGGRRGYVPAMLYKRNLVTFEKATGKVDLLSPEEHEARIRDLVVDFVKQMPPVPDCPKAGLIAKLTAVKFLYDKSLSVPYWNGSAIVLPGEKRDLWGTEPYNRIAAGGRAMYLLAFHEMGHALHEFAVEKLGRIAWVRKLTYGSAGHSTWEPASVLYPMPTVGAPGLSWKIRLKAVAFTEATAEFSAWCVYDYLEKAHAETFGKSVYFERDYLKQFDVDTHALATCRHGGWQVEGVQVVFLRSLYAGVAAPLAYGDFLRTMILYQKEHFFLRWVPARAIDEWVAMKLKHKGPGAAVTALARKFNIIGGSAIFIQATRDGAIRVNGTPLKMTIKELQFYRLQIGDKVIIDDGRYVVNFTATSHKAGVMDHIRIGALSVRPGCEFEITGPLNVRVAKGKFASGGVHMSTPAGKVKHTKTSYIVEVGADGSTTVEVVDGAVEIETARGKTALEEGQAAHVDAAGVVKATQPQGSEALAKDFDPAAPTKADSGLAAALPVKVAKPPEPPLGKPVPDSVDSLIRREMAALALGLGQMAPRAAVARVLGLYRTWREQQRGQWSVLLEWVRAQRARTPALNAAGRHRLNTLEEDLTSLIVQEAEWRNVRLQVEKTADFAERQRMLRTYLLHHLGGFYYREAEALRDAAPVRRQPPDD